MTDTALRGLKPGENLVEALPVRGSGSILFQRRPSGRIEIYFRSRKGGKDQKVSIGTYRTGSGVGITLVEAREAARELSSQALKAETDLKTHLSDLATQQAAEEAIQREAASAEASKGSVEDLFRDYIASRKGVVSNRQLNEFERFLATELLGQNPEVARMRACDVRPKHVQGILKAIWDRGSRSMSDKARSYLHAAFRYGIGAEFSVVRPSQKTFGLEMNPVAAIPKEHRTRPATRALSDAELKHFWKTISLPSDSDTDTKETESIMALFLKFLIATGGQRLEQVLREPWESYDLKAKTLRLIDSKGKGSVARIHLVPLTDRAINLLLQAKKINPGATYPWANNMSTRFEIASPNRAVSRWLKSKHGICDGKRIEPFTPRDFRRTCTQIMQRNGIKDSLSDLLQSHGQTGVVAVHYRNSPEAYLPEKRLAAELFEKALSQILEGSPSAESRASAAMLQLVHRW